MARAAADHFGDGPWESFDESLALTSDGAVRLLPTPGHTRGHLSVAIDTGERVALIAGDASYSERTLLDGVVDGVAEDAGAHRDSTARIRELCRRRDVVYLPTHDPESATRLGAMSARRPRPAPMSSLPSRLQNRLTAAHVHLYRASGGRLGGRFRSAPVMLLDHVGRKSGQRRTSPLIYARDGDDVLLIASNGGDARAPCLVSQPDRRRRRRGPGRRRVLGRDGSRRRGA